MSSLPEKKESSILNSDKAPYFRVESTAVIEDALLESGPKSHSISASVKASPAPPTSMTGFGTSSSSFVSTKPQTTVKATSNFLSWPPSDATSSFSAPMPTIGDRMPLLSLISPSTLPYPNFLPTLFPYAAFGQALGGVNVTSPVTSQNRTIPVEPIELAEAIPQSVSISFQHYLLHTLKVTVSVAQISASSTFLSTFPEESSSQLSSAFPDESGPQLKNISQGNTDDDDDDKPIFLNKQKRRKRQ